MSKELQNNEEEYEVPLLARIIIGYIYFAGLVVVVTTTVSIITNVRII